MWGGPEIKKENPTVEKKKPVPTIEKQKTTLTKVDEKKATQILWPVVEQIKQNPTVENLIVKEMFDKIDKDNTLKDVWWNKIQELLKEWKIWEAITTWLDIIMNSIFGKKDKKTELFFPQFKHLDEDIVKLDLWNKSLTELEWLKKWFEDKVSNADSVKRKISYTYMLSKIIEQYEHRKYPNTTWLQIIEKQLTIWSVILLNKQNAGAWGKMLQSIWDWDVDMTHVIVVTEMWPPIKFSHATEHKFSNSSQSWIETNVPLWDYLKWSYADIVITNPPETNKWILQQRLQNIKADEAFTYDKTAAIKWAVWVDNVNWKPAWKFNCGTYVQEVLWIDGKDLAVPGNWLKDSKLKPSYMFTFEPNKQGS